MKDKPYLFVSNSIDDSGAVKIISGKYAGLIYSYGKVQFAETGNPDGKMAVRFEYNAFNNPDASNDNWQDGHFIDFIGGILIDILQDEVDSGRIGNFLKDNVVENDGIIDTTFSSEKEIQDVD